MNFHKGFIATGVEGDARRDTEKSKTDDNEF